MNLEKAYRTRKFAREILFFMAEEVRSGISEEDFMKSKFFGHAKKILFPINGELNLLSPGSGCPLQAGTGHGARTGSGPMLMRGDIFAASRGGGAGY